MVKRLLVERIGLELLRLIPLALLAGGVVFGGYWLLEHEFHLTLSSVWSGLVHFWKTFSLYDFWYGLVAWVNRMWIQWLIIEVPKRVLIAFGIPYVALIVIGPTRRKALQAWFARRKRLARIRRYQTVRWFRRHFGRYAGWAIGFLVATIMGILFWFVFGTFVFLWLGLWKLPAFLTTFLTLVWRWLSGLLQKIPFRTTLFKLIGRLWSSLVTVPWAPSWARSEAAQSRRRRAARWAIRQRYASRRRINRSKARLMKLGMYVARRQERKTEKAR